MKEPAFKYVDWWKKRFADHTDIEGFKTKIIYHAHSSDSDNENITDFL